MKYLSKTVTATMSKPRYLFLYIVFSLYTVPLYAIRQIGIISGTTAFVLMLVGYVYFTFLIAGVYSAAWKNLKGEPANILEEAKIYFPRILVVSFFIGFLSAFVFVQSTIILKKVNCIAIMNVAYSNRLDDNLIVAVSRFPMTALFFYAFPAIIVANLSASKALLKAWRFILGHFAESVTVILLLLFNAAWKVMYTQWTVNIDPGSFQYWKIITVSHILSYILTFLAFLTAAQIFEKSTR